MTDPDTPQDPPAASAFPRLRRGLLVAVLTAAACALAILLVESHAPRPPEIHSHDFILKRPRGVTLEIEPGRPVDVPFPFGDVDLFADVVLENGAELEIAFRRVEPVQREGGIEPFHARYGLLRLSTIEAGPVLLSRDEAVLADEPLFGGHLLVPDEKVSIQLQARGRTVTANVGGVEYGPFETADAHGAFAFVVHHAGAEIPFLEIRRVPRPLHLLPIGWAALLGAGLGLLAGLVGRGGVRLLGLLAVPAVAWLAGGLVIAHLADEAEPSTLGMLSAALAGLPLAWLCIAAPQWWTLLGGVLFAAVGIEVAARIEAPRIPLLEDPRLAALLGPDSGAAAFDVLVPRLRAPSEVYRPKQDEPQVVWLGGAPVWEDGREPSRWVAQLATDRARRELGESELEAVVLGTLWANMRQQVLLLEYLLDRTWWTPRLVVLGVAEWEGEPTEDPRIVAALDAAFADEPEQAPSGWSTSAVLALWSAAHAAREEPAAPVTGESAAVALDRLLGELAEQEIPLLVVAAPGLDGAIRAALRSRCEATGQARFEVVETLGRDPQASVEALVPVLAEMLRR